MNLTMECWPTAVAVVVVALLRHLELRDGRSFVRRRLRPRSRAQPATRGERLGRLRKARS